MGAKLHNLWPIRSSFVNCPLTSCVQPVQAQKHIWHGSRGKNFPLLSNNFGTFVEVPSIHFSSPMDGVLRKPINSKRLQTLHQFGIENAVP